MTELSDVGVQLQDVTRLSDPQVLGVVSSALGSVAQVLDLGLPEPCDTGNDVSNVNGNGLARPAILPSSCSVGRLWSR